MYSLPSYFERRMSREAKHLWPRKTQQVANTQITFVGQTNKASRSKTITAPQQSRNPNYIFRTNEQCPAKQNTYGPVTKQKPKLHLSDERTMPRKAKHLRLRDAQQMAKTQTTVFGTNEQCPAKQWNGHVLAQELLQSLFVSWTGVWETHLKTLQHFEHHNDIIQMGHCNSKSPKMILASCRTSKNSSVVFLISPSTSQAWSVS